MQCVLGESIFRLLIVFDMDGTLTTAHERVVQAMTVALATKGFDAPIDAEIMSTVGLQPVDMIGALLKGRSHASEVSEVEIHAMADCYKAEITARRLADPEAEKAFPGAVELLQSMIQQGMTLGVATGKGRSDLNGVLSMLNWHNYFKTLQPAEVGPGKPDPAQLLAAISEIETSPRHTLMIGDTAFDMEMAGRAGVKGIGVTWGSHDRQRLNGAGASKIVDSFPELHTAIQEMIADC